MNVPLPGVTVDPQGVSTSVAITDSRGNTPTAYSDRFGVNTVALPDTITARTTFFLPGEGPWTITPTASGQVTKTTTLTLEDSQVATVTVGSVFDASQWEQFGAYVASGAPNQITGLVDDGGTTDNTAAILAYITTYLEVNASGGVPRAGLTIPLPPGIFGCHLAGTNAIPQGVRLIGAGGNLSATKSNEGTTLVAVIGSGQTEVISLDNRDSGVDHLTISAHRNACAVGLQVNALTCYVGDDVAIIGGSTASLKLTSSAGSTRIGRVYINNNDAGAPIYTSCGDLQVTGAFVNGTVPNQFGTAALNNTWTNVHFIATGGTGALINDMGANVFSACGFDSCGGTALIDRTGATAPSSFTGPRILQALGGVTGVPIIKETTNAAAGASIVGAITPGTGPNGAGSTFSHFIDTPVASTNLEGITISSGWLSGSFFGTVGGQYHGITVAGVPLAPPGKIIGSHQYAPATKTTLSVTGTTLTALDTTNATVTFIAGATGNVLVKATAVVDVGTSATNAVLGWLNASGGAQVGVCDYVDAVTNPQKTVAEQILTGLTPGTTYTLQLAAACNTAGDTVNVICNGTTGTNSNGSPLVLTATAL